MAITSKPQTIAITGANGFIGSRLVRVFSRQGWRVLAFCRAAQTQAPIPNVTFKEFGLPDRFRKEDFEGGEVLIHCAFDRHTPQNPDSDANNIRGTERLLALSRDLGYRQFVFLSSLSAHDTAESHYGRHKKALEALFDPARDLVLRPGLTLGDGGLARAMFDAIRANPVLPLVGGGRQPVYTIGIDELCETLARLIGQGRTGTYSIAARQPVTLRALHQGLARKAGVHPVLIPLPYRPVFLAVKLAERLGLALPITTENLLGLKQLRTVDLSADLLALEVEPRPFDETLLALEVSRDDGPRSNLMARLRPTEPAIHALALRETDPGQYARFTPLTRGPVFTLLALLGIGLLAVVLTPFRLLRSPR